MAMAMGVGLVGCQKAAEESSAQTSNTSTAQEKIVVKAADSKTKIILGQTLQLTSSVEGVTWESSDATIATVSATGLVTAVKVGSVKITAKKDGFKEGTISLTVELEKLTVTAAANKTSLVQGETVQLTASKEGVTYTSSDATIASVSATGLVTALKAGQVTIKVSKEGFQDGTIALTITRPEATATLHFEDAAHYAADGFWESSSYGPVYTPIYSKEQASDGTCVAYFGEGDKETLTFTSTAAVKAELTMKVLYYSAVEDLGSCYNIKVNNTDVSVAGIAYAGSYEILEISLGEHTLIAGQNTVEINLLGVSPYLDDFCVYASAATTIAVVAAPEMLPIEVTETTITIEEGQTAQLTCATEGVTYTSTAEATATVSATGLVTAVAKGNANINITKAGMKSARVKVVVTEKVLAGELRVEAETGTIDGEALGDDSAIKTRTASTGETITAQWAADTTLTLKVTATNAGSYQLYLNGRAGGQYGMSNIEDLATVIEVKINGVALAVTGAISGRTYTDYLLGTVTLVAGENTITIKSIGEADTAPNIDFLKFVPATAAA